MHATEHDHIRICLGGFLRETERIACKIRHVLDFRHLIIMCENDGVQLLF